MKQKPHQVLLQTSSDPDLVHAINVQVPPGDIRKHFDASKPGVPNLPKESLRGRFLPSSQPPTKRASDIATVRH